VASQINIMVGGEAGQGVQSVGFVLSKTFARGGYHVFSDQDYESRVRGGHNFYRIRAASSEVTAADETVDILLALNEESVGLHREEVSPSGIIVFDDEKVKGADGKGSFGVPLRKLTGNKIMENTVALGVALGLMKYDISILEKVLEEQFGAGDIGTENKQAARAGYDYVRDNYTGDFSSDLRRTGRLTHRMLLNGNEAIALGAMAAGCRYVSSYPMTPSTSVMEYMAARADEYGMVVMQAEDEVSAVNMIVGAGFAGARSMTTTSGSGFCLMVEGLGLAGITETPIVIVDAQRPGPAVGLPTRTAQGDLQFMLTAHHGDFPRIVLAPLDVEDCFWLTTEAFNLADIYQTPVIILTDQYLASSYATVPRFDLSKVVIDRGELYSGDSADYKRHAITESGISPRAFPGLGKSLVVTDSDEHDETGHLTEDAETTNRIVRKRLRKMDGLDRRILRPRAYGRTRADTLLIGWGSSCGPMREAVDILQGEGVKVGMINLNHLYPFPAGAVKRAIDSARKSFVVEGNATGQLARLVKTETVREADGLVLRYDGRPFTPAYIIETLEKEGL
jgi:2-oxoglutarate ferredoxin oxidoreductase subunit alpha